MKNFLLIVLAILIWLPQACNEPDSGDDGKDSTIDCPSGDRGYINFKLIDKDSNDLVFDLGLLNTADILVGHFSSRNLSLDEKELFYWQVWEEEAYGIKVLQSDFMPYDFYFGEDMSIYIKDTLAFIIRVVENQIADHRYHHCYNLVPNR